MFLLLCAWLALHTPPPLSYDPDMGVQTAGAPQIAAGEYPFVHWRTTYGPSRFYASYLARRISHNRIGAEIVLCEAAYVLAYWLLFWCALMLTDSMPGAALTTAAACLLLPRMHKYFILLGPIWTLFCALRYLQRPSWRNLIGIAIGITVTALYRMDYGFWTLLAGGLTVMLEEMHLPVPMNAWKRRMLFAFVALPAAVILLSAPWLVFLLIHGSLRNFLYESTIDGLNLANGLWLPYPTYQHGLSITDPANLLAMSFPGQYLVYLSSVAFIAWRWRYLTSLRRKQLAVVLILATTGLFQSMYRSDYAHLLQSICNSHLLAGFLIVESVRQCWLGKIWLPIPVIMVSIVYAITIAAGLTYGAHELVYLDGLQAWSWFYSKLPRAGMQAALQKYPDDAMVAMINGARALKPAGQRIFFRAISNLCLHAQRPPVRVGTALFRVIIYLSQVRELPRLSAI